MGDGKRESPLLFAFANCSCFCKFVSLHRMSQQKQQQQHLFDPVKFYKIVVFTKGRNSIIIRSG